MLTALGVDLAQGYHVGRPFPTALLQPAGAPSCSRKEATA
jgi:EAL domain-containing protein (putative c-di-GMP-specific phosphodiesterase class I)